ncbi:MAG: 30S ribosomal protein S1 [Ruminococcus sp.]|nr:30S ribosomal protein S1 [Ruminococcus sp.]
MKYRPEGCLIRTAENQRYISSPEGLAEAMEKGVILEGRAAVCDSSHDLIVDLPCARGMIPRAEGAIGIADGKTRDIALISRVNKAVCFKVKELYTGSGGTLTARLSRLAAQEECMSCYIDTLSPGDIIDAKVTHMEQFGCFVDIGCGIPSMIPIDSISVSRIAHPSDRFVIGQMIRAVVKSSTSAEDKRICLTHRELLGTWEENAASFSPGETIAGIVRSVEDYGVFVELKPNLAGLAELKSDVYPGQLVSVFIKAIIPEKMKVKLIIVDSCGDCADAPPQSAEYFVSGAHIDKWVYSPAVSGKDISTDFTAQG